MSTPLLYPANHAPTSDWVYWIQELKAMPSSPEVRKALREAERTVKQHRRHEKHHARAAVGRMAFA